MDYSTTFASCIGSCNVYVYYLTMYSLQTYKRDVDMYGSQDPPVCPTVLITVSAEDDPSTVTKLKYKISLRGIKPCGRIMYIVRNLCTGGKHLTV